MAPNQALSATDSAPLGFHVVTVCKCVHTSVVQCAFSKCNEFTGHSVSHQIRLLHQHLRFCSNLVHLMNGSQNQGLVCFHIFLALKTSFSEKPCLGINILKSRNPSLIRLF